jgi:putative transposase
VKKSRFTDGRISFALKQAETRTPVAEVIRRMGIWEQTFYLYSGLGPRGEDAAETARGGELEAEVADLSLDKHIS